MSKFTLLDKPIAHPGKCISCGAHDRPVIDFGILILRVGKVYVCTGCMIDAGSIMGLVEEASDETTLVQEQYDNFVEKVSAQVDRFSLAFSDSIGDFTRSLDILMVESKRHEEPGTEHVTDGNAEQRDEREEPVVKATGVGNAGKGKDGPTFEPLIF